MGKKLAIKGHPTRGKEVIELLVMMGGTNPFSNGMVIGNKATNCYYISEDTATKYISWDYIGPDKINEYEIFTLEEFLEKYPFKVGDKIIDDSGESGIIIEMKWDEEIIYKVDFGKECYYFTSDFLRPYKEANMNENKFGTTKEPLETKSNAMKLIDDIHERTHEDVIFDSIIWHLRNSVNNGKQNLSGGECEDYFREVVKKNNENKMKNALVELLEHIKTTPKEELEKEFKEIEEWSNVGPTVEEFMTFCETVNKKPTYTYPTTYEECCEVLMGKTNFSEFTLVPIKYSNTTKFDNNVSPDAPYIDIFNNLYTILICRDAYWKIAGEQMGLSKPWEPDWTNLDQMKYCIWVDIGEFITMINVRGQHILAFPTEEMRDVFYENFKDLIEQCKELL